LQTPPKKKTETGPGRFLRGGGPPKNPGQKTAGDPVFFRLLRSGGGEEVIEMPRTGGDNEHGVCLREKMKFIFS